MDREVQRGVREVYSEKRRREAVDLWFELYGTISVEDFVAELGYPCASTMSRWIKADPRHDPDRARYDSHPVLTKLQAVGRVAEGASLAQAARESGLAPSAVWRAVDRHARGGTAALLPGWKGEQVAGGEKGEGRRPSPAMQAPPPAAAGDLPDDPAALKAMAEELRMDNAILREVLDVLKAACPTARARPTCPRWPTCSTASPSPGRYRPRPTRGWRTPRCWRRAPRCAPASAPRCTPTAAATTGGRGGRPYARGGA